MTHRPDHRMLLVHAHPDDESINNGATMARYVDEGVGVTLVTCTAGEMGEVARARASPTSPTRRREGWGSTAAASSTRR